MAEKEESPEIHEQYLHNLGLLKPYRQEIATSLKKVKIKKNEKDKLDIEDLVNQILKASENAAKKHWGDKQMEEVKLDYDSVKEFLEENVSKLKEGELEDDLRQHLSGLYHQRASQHSLTKYQTGLHQLPLDKAKESIKKIAKFTGNEPHYTHIDRTLKHDTLMRRAARYHDNTIPKVEGMVDEKQYAKKKGYNDFLNYTPPEDKKK